MPEMTYEYICIHFDFNDLADLNSLSSTGWHVVSVQRLASKEPGGYAELPFVALLERMKQNA